MAPLVGSVRELVDRPLLTRDYSLSWFLFLVASRATGCAVCLILFHLGGNAVVGFLRGCGYRFTSRTAGMVPLRGFYRAQKARDLREDGVGGGPPVVVASSRRPPDPPPLCRYLHFCALGWIAQLKYVVSSFAFLTRRLGSVREGWAGKVGHQIHTTLGSLLLACNDWNSCHCHARLRHLRFYFCMFR